MTQTPQRGTQAPPQQQTQALVQTGGPLAVTKWNMTTEQLELLKRTIAKDTTDDEFALFMTVAQRRGLDPFDRQIHAVKRWDPDAERKVMAIQVGIDGYRLGAARTGEEDGQEGPFWCGADGAWKDVWLSEEAPLAAKVIRHRKGRSRGYVGIALWGSYVQLKKDGTPNAMWRKHGPGQLAKCAEALAIRMAFPQELGGTHTDDELGTDAIDVEFTEIKATPATTASSSTTAGPVSAGASSSSPASQTGPAVAASSKSAAAAPAPVKDTRPLTEDEIVELIEDLSHCGTKAALTVWRKQRCEPALARSSDAQRERLARAAEGQLAEIELASRGGGA